LRELMNIFSTAEGRADSFVICFCRLADIQNLKMLRARMSRKEWAALQDRIGKLALFPFFQLEQSELSFQLSIYEERVAASVALTIGFRESSHNLSDFYLEQTDGKSYVFVAGVPMSWEKLDQLPSSGRFGFSYNCSADERKLSIRRDMCRKFGGWNIHDGVTKQIIWWSRLDAAPAPVLTFLYYCMKEFRDDAYVAFTMIDGPGGNGEVSFSEMKEAVAEWGWGKFRKNPDLVRQVFRYLDPDGGGEISLAEWGTMNQLFKELQLSILEFLQFVDRKYGNFDDAWAAMDADGGGSVDEEEWGETVEAIGFFGQSDVIFQYLSNDLREDKVRRGSEVEPLAKGQKQAVEVTQSDWKKLEPLWEDRVNIQRKIMTAGL